MPILSCYQLQFYETEALLQKYLPKSYFYTENKNFNLKLAK